MKLAKHLKELHNYHNFTAKLIVALPLIVCQSHCAWNGKAWGPGSWMNAAQHPNDPWADHWYLKYKFDQVISLPLRAGSAYLGFFFWQAHRQNLNGNPNLVICFNAMLSDRKIKHTCLDLNSNRPENAVSNISVSSLGQDRCPQDLKHQQGVPMCNWRRRWRSSKIQSVDQSDTAMRQFHPNHLFSINFHTEVNAYIAE